jgi:hypothetical protein
MTLQDYAWREGMPEDGTDEIDRATDRQYISDPLLGRNYPNVQELRITEQWNSIHLSVEETRRVLVKVLGTIRVKTDIWQLLARFVSVTVVRVEPCSSRQLSPKLGFALSLSRIQEPQRRTKTLTNEQAGSFVKGVSHEFSPREMFRQHSLPSLSPSLFPYKA